MGMFYLLALSTALYLYLDYRDSHKKRRIKPAVSPVYRNAAVFHFRKRKARAVFVNWNRGCVAFVDWISKLFRPRVRRRVSYVQYPKVTLRY